MDDSWDVEAVVQYRTYYRKEQWLIKWQGYGEDRNTWEPKEHLLEEWVQQQAEEVKQKAVEHHQRTRRAAPENQGAVRQRCRHHRCRGVQVGKPKSLSQRR